ncbi:MAG TPA: long-chain fatty acid--CoA ligase [Planctomycetaceae bacterium]|nr:long-chain fatty acid--CoA ligase [Planctomycetaceae bacterium]
MEASRLQTERRMAASAYPLKARWCSGRFPWLAQYPSDVPPGLDVPRLRTEQLLLCAHERYADRIALRYYRTHWTYGELLRRVRQAAAHLAEMGIESGDRALVVLPNCPDFVVLFFALHWLGAEIVPANPLLSGKDLIHLAELAAPSLVIGLDVRLKPVLQLLRQRRLPRLIVSSLAPHLPVYLRWPYRLRALRSNLAQRLNGTEVVLSGRLYRHDRPALDAPVSRDPDAPAVLQPTGGTTGTPKVAVLRHSNLHANVAQLHAWCRLEAGKEVVLAVLPFFHVFGATVGLLSSIAGGATLLLQARFHPSRVWQVMHRWRPTVAPMVPFMFAALCEEMRRRGRDLSGLRCGFSGASALPAGVKQEFQDRTGAAIFEGYGLSEASPVTHSNPAASNARTGSIGLPLPETEARIVDPHTGRTVLPAGQVGELLVRGPQIMAGYLNQPDETAQVLRDGWLHTGDLARMDPDGFFYLVDRKKDMIISAGLNVYPAEVERVLEEHPQVAECAVVGLPDRFYGEKVVAFVVPTQATRLDVRELKAFCQDRMAGYKVPREFQVCEELPRTFLGKLRRVELRRRAA